MLIVREKTNNSLSKALAELKTLQSSLTEDAGKIEKQIKKLRAKEKKILTDKLAVKNTIFIKELQDTVGKNLLPAEGIKTIISLTPLTKYGPDTYDKEEFYCDMSSDDAIEEIFNNGELEIIFNDGIHYKIVLETSYNTWCDEIELESIDCVNYRLGDSITPSKEQFNVIMTLVKDYVLSKHKTDGPDVEWYIDDILHDLKKYFNQDTDSDTSSSGGDDE